MVFVTKSNKIDEQEITSLYRLEGSALERKEARDRELESIIKGEDQRILLVIGPCSSDNEEAVMEYARRLADLQEQVKDQIFIVMRVYTAKPRTNGDGYKGLMHQPDTQAAPSFVDGLKAVRHLHYRVITETGLTTADELLYPASLPYVEDLISYHAIGARSVEDQEHRFVSSGISAPTGMKNPTSGNLSVMFNAIYAAQHPQNFLFNAQAVETSGNPLAHAILRGGLDASGKNIPNYHYEDLLAAAKRYSEMGLQYPFILVDTNHDNSGKQFEEQVRIVRETMMNRAWNKDLATLVRGFMIESYLEDGRQNEPVVYGQSITDPCLGWGKTQALVKEIATMNK